MKSFTRFLRTPTNAPAPIPLQDEINRARALHQQRDYQGSSNVYLSLLKSYPDKAEIHYRLGNVLKDLNALEQALASYDRAIELKPDYAHAFCNRAVVLGLLNRPLDALKDYQRALDFDPDDSIAYCNRAVLLVGLGQKDAALQSFESASLRDGDNFTANFGRGVLLQERNRWADSLAAYDRAVALQPNDSASLYNRATVLKELKRWDEALKPCEQAIAINPQLWHPHAKRGEILQELNRRPEALVSFDRAIELNAGDAATLNNRGVLLQSMGRFTEALADYDHALKLNPKYAEAWFNRGSVQDALDDFDAALISYERAIVERENYDAAYVNRGNALYALGLSREAINSYNQAIALNADLPEAHYNLALVSLSLGYYAKGWAEHEWRWLAKGGPIYRERRYFSEPLWLGGESIAGKSILLYSEQGLGDSIQFVRYVELVARLGPKVIVEAPAPLVKLFSSLPGVERVIAYGDRLPHFDVQCPFMSLPLAFKTTLDSIPSSAGYLSTDGEKVAEWQQRLGMKNKPRVGLTWSGNQAPGTNRKRRFALSSFIPYLPDDFDYFCLQTEILTADRETLANTAKVRQFEGLLKDFADTAALCECMDFVISVDTSVAHLAGALGKPTWVLLAFVADWRWLTDREDSPWYSSVRLIRQRSSGDWSSVFERVAKDLANKLLEFRKS